MSSLSRTGKAENVVETSRLLLRPWDESDLDEYAQMLADPDVMRYLTHEYGPLSREEAVQAHGRILRHWQVRGFGAWAAMEKSSGRWVGKIGLNLLGNWPGPHKVEVEWQLNVPFWGRGYATEGGRAAVHFGFDRLGLDRIISITVPQHVASQQIMRKCGLTYQGIVQLDDPRTRTKRDIVWYAIDHTTWESQARTPQARPGR
jgi:RimJ/RimL family protein N-acetyltransferase